MLKIVSQSFLSRSEASFLKSIFAAMLLKQLIIIVGFFLLNLNINNTIDFQKDHLSNSVSEGGFYFWRERGQISHST